MKLTFFKKDILTLKLYLLVFRTKIEVEGERERSSSYKHNYLFFCETSEILLISQTPIANCTKELMQKGKSEMNRSLFEGMLDMEDEL